LPRSRLTFVDRWFHDLMVSPHRQWALGQDQLLSQLPLRRHSRYVTPYIQPAATSALTTPRRPNPLSLYSGRAIRQSLHSARVLTPYSVELPRGYGNPPIRNFEGSSMIRR